MTRALLDTSMFIAREQGRLVGDPEPEPDEVAVSVVTLAELEQGVLMASDETSRAARLETLVAAREEAVGIGVDQEIASAYARLAAEARRGGRRPRINATWIAATALAHAVPLVTQDADFEHFRGVDVILV